MIGPLDTARRDAAAATRPADTLERPRPPQPAADEAAEPTNTIPLPQGARGGPAEALAQAIARLEPNFLPEGSRLSIARDTATERFVYRSVDPLTGEVLKQWPAEEFLKVLGALREVEGLVLDARV